MRIALLLLAFAAAQDKKPAAPRATVARPLTVEAGRKTKLTVRGHNLDGLTGVRMHEPKSKASLAGKPAKVAVAANHPAERVGDWEVDVELDLAAEIPGGWVAFSLVGPGGESNAVKVALADGTPRVAEKEPNDNLRQPQIVALPCAIDGTIKQDRDVDAFRFDGKKGDVVRLEVQAARFGSPLDAMLTLYDADRRIIDSCDDFEGGADPVLVVTLPKDGAYTLVLIDVNDLGGPPFAYRLLLRKP